MKSWARVLLLSVIFISLGFSLVANMGLKENSMTQGDRLVLGEVLDYDIIMRSRSSSGQSTRYVASIKYRFEVNGTSYLSRSNNAFGSISNKRELIDKVEAYISAMDGYCVVLCQIDDPEASRIFIPNDHNGYMNLALVSTTTLFGAALFCICMVPGNGNRVVGCRK